MHVFVHAVMLSFFSFFFFMGRDDIPIRLAISYFDFQIGWIKDLREIIFIKRCRIISIIGTPYFSFFSLCKYKFWRYIVAIDEICHFFAEN